MYKVKTLNKIAAIGTKRFDKTRYEVSNTAENPDAILVRSANMLDMDMPHELKAIARAGAGVNNIPVELCSQKGIVVFNTPGANANAVKELAIAALLMSSRKIVAGVQWAAGLSHNIDVAKEVENGKKDFVGPELYGKKLGVFGLGAIGAMVANTATELGMDVYGYDPYITIDNAWMLYRNVKRATDPKTIYEHCDYICLHVPSTPETKGFINTKAFDMMKPGMRVINLSRGDLVNNEDMAAALESGKVASYLTDFPSADVLKMKNVIAIPHLGASTPESEDNCAVMAVDELIDFLENGNIKNSVNFPDVQNPKGGDESICVIHKNVPNVLAQISAAISSESLNIENLSSRSKKDYAYSVCEIAGHCPDSLIEKLTAVEGVIRVNVIRNR
ncbi:MAG: phosphoglycerate dehydrogenase [Eubacteriales bacterium]|nr:phosphoglycerate dehydrogenase [Eubacteriales bacterium]